MGAPNVIMFTWHDAGDWFGCYGATTVNTPHIDRLARSGVRFANNFSACAICSPSRASIATGMHCQRHGVMTLTNNPLENRIHPHIPHVAKRMKALGYRSALFGTQHEAAHEHTDQVMGFDEQFATDPWPSSDLLAHYVKRWLLAQAGEERPFYAQIGTFDAHLNRFYNGKPPRPDEPYPPVQDTSKGLYLPPYLGGSEADQATVATLQGLLQRGDLLMGAVLDGLAAAGLADNTIIVMNVDHGVGLARAKGTCYDAGNKTAWIISAPGRLPAGHVVEALTSHIDVLPTLWELLDQPAIAGLDGVSLADHARARRRDEVHDAVYSHMVENIRAIRTTRHLLIRNTRPQRATHLLGDCAHHMRKEQQGGRRPEVPGDDQVPDAQHHQVLCFDRVADPDQIHHDPHALAEVRSELDGRLWDHLLDVDDCIVHDPIRTPWQVATRAGLVAHCQRRGRAAPRAEGPLGNPIDAASARGEVID